MATDIQLDAGHQGDRILFQAATLQAEAADLILDSPARRKRSGGFRRALVHDSNDGLTINFNGDYPGGVTISNAKLTLRPIDQDGPEPKLPKDAPMGTLLLLLNSWGPEGMFGLRESRLSLWLCIGRGGGISMIKSGSRWVPIPLGESVEGTV